MCFTFRGSMGTLIILCCILRSYMGTPVSLYFMLRSSMSMLISLCFMLQGDSGTPVSLCFTLRSSIKTLVSLEGKLFPGTLRPEQAQLCGVLRAIGWGRLSFWAGCTCFACFRKYMGAEYRAELSFCSTLSFVFGSL